MAKKANNKQIFFLVAIAFGIAAVLMNLLPVMRLKVEILGSEVVTNYTGFEMMFSGDNTEFVVVALIAGILMVVGLVAALLIKVVEKNKAFLFKVISAAAFIVATVLIFAFLKASFVSANNADILEDFIGLGVGGYLAGIFSALAGVGILLA